MSLDLNSSGKKFWPRSLLEKYYMGMKTKQEDKSLLTSGHWNQVTKDSICFNNQKHIWVQQTLCVRWLPSMGRGLSRNRIDDGLSCTFQQMLESRHLHQVRSAKKCRNCECYSTTWVDVLYNFILYQMKQIEKYVSSLLAHKTGIGFLRNFD